jgi:parvulin-like peptidyl-prolyl isomerase
MRPRLFIPTPFAPAVIVLSLAAVSPSCSSSPSPSPPGSTPSSSQPKEYPTDFTVARVNGRHVPFTHLRILTEEKLRADAGRTVDRRRVYRQALDDLIRRELLLQEAVARGIRADERLVEKAYDEKRSSLKDEDAWKQMLARDGMTPESIKAEIRAQLTVQALLNSVAAEVPADAVTEDEISAFYKQNPTAFETGEQRAVSHILIRVPPEADTARKSESRQRIERLRARIAKGEDFSVLARAFSEDPLSRERGGRLPPIARGQMVETFEKAAFALEPDQVSAIVETPFGFHLIKSHGVLPSRRLTLPEVRESIRHRLLAEKRSQAVSSLVASLRSHARIETYLE